MIVSDEGQARVFLINVVVGILCVLLFDLFYVIRKKYVRKTLWINVCDGMYFICVFLLLLFAGLKYNFGALRYYQLAGIGIGICAQAFLLSKFERKVLEKIVTAGEIIVTVMLKIIVVPCAFVIKLVITPLLRAESWVMKKAEKISKSYKKVKMKRKKRRKTVKKRIKMI